MSKNTNLSFLTDFLTADIVNSRVGMNNVSPQTTFDVTGTGKFSGILTLGSTVSNGTYTYTLPSATGTLALVGGSGVGTVTSVAAITLGTSGTDLTSTVANGTTTPVITLNVPDASVTARGVITTGTQYIAGLKIFTSTIVANVDLQLPAAGTASTTFIKNINATGLSSFGSNGFGFNNADNIYFSGSNKAGGVFAFNNTGNRTYTLQDASGTLAFTSQIPTNAVGGTGTLNTIPKFTAATTIGNSNIFDSGSIIYNTNPAAGTFAWQFNGSTITGQSYGAQVIAGTNASDIGFKVMNAAASINYLVVRGDGLVTLTGALNGTSATFAINNASLGNATNLNLQQAGSGDVAVSYLLTGTREWLVGVDNSDSDAFKINNITGTSDFNNIGLSIATTGAATFSSSVTANSLLVERSASRNMLGISSVSLPTSGDEEGVAVIKTNSTLWQLSTVGYAVDSKGVRFYNNGGTGYTAFEVAQAGGTRFIVNGVGNVGIGASSLLERLGVNGNIHVEGVGNSIYFDTDGNGRTIQQYVANLYEFHIVNARGNSARFILGNNSISLGTSSTPQFNINTSNGNIGIGTVVDNGRKLNVNGSGLFSGTLSTAKVEVGAVESVNITTNSTFTLVSSSNFNIRTNILVSVTIRWNSNANAQRQYLLFIGATDTGWGTPNSAISVIASNDWSSGYVGAASFSIGGSGSLRTLNISVSGAATYNVTAYAAIVDM